MQYEIRSAFKDHQSALQRIVEWKLFYGVSNDFFGRNAVYFECDRWTVECIKQQYVDYAVGVIDFVGDRRQRVVECGQLTLSNGGNFGPF